MTWIRDGLPVEFGDKYEFYHKDDGTCTLVVNNPKMIDSGRYLIKAENCAGSLDLVHKLIFEGRKIIEKKKKMGSIEIENETKPRVHAKPKESAVEITTVSKEVVAEESEQPSGEAEQDSQEDLPEVTSEPGKIKGKPILLST